MLRRKTLQDYEAERPFDVLARLAVEGNDTSKAFMISRGYIWKDNSWQKIR